ncbi:MAG: hypothetical protein LBL83_09795 [Clostridiales bacterium]|nr:hypothetical protein [Clostridiales bacterium]
MAESQSEQLPLPQPASSPRQEQGEQAAEPQALFCEVCGEKMPAGSVFCGICGNAVGAGALPAPALSPSPTPAPPQAKQLFPQPQEWAPEAHATQAQPSPPRQARSKATAIEIPASPARVAASVALGFLLFLSVCALLLLSVAHSLTDGGIKDAVQRMDLSKVAVNSGIAEIVNDNIGHTTRDLFGIDADGIAELFQRSSFKESIGSALAGYIDALAGGDARHSLSAREVQRILRGNASAIRSQFGYELTDEDYDRVAEYLNEYGMLDDYSVGALMSEYGASMAMLYALLSVYALAAAGALCLTLAFDIFLVNLRRARSALPVCGAAIGAAGALYAALGLLAPSLGGLIGGRAGRLLIEAANGLGATVLCAGLIALAVGVLAVAAFFVIGAVKKTAGAHRLPRRTIPAIAANAVGALCCGALLFLCARGMPAGTSTLAELRERRPPATAPATTEAPDEYVDDAEPR